MHPLAVQAEGTLPKLEGTLTPEMGTHPKLGGGPSTAEKGPRGPLQKLQGTPNPRFG